MSLSDVMSGAGLASYAEAALVVSVATFVGIAVWAFRRPREEMEARARTALDDGGSEQVDMDPGKGPEKGLRA